MSTTFVNLPTLAANGAGTAVAMAAFDSNKTIVNAGNGGVFEPTCIIEISNDLAAAVWSPLVTFTAAGSITRLMPCRWLRATVANYRGGGAPQVDVGADTATILFATLTPTIGNGSGAATDVSTLPLVKSIQVGGTFGGTVNIEISEDGTNEWSGLLSFTAPGVQVAQVTAHYLRATRTGVPTVSPGLPTISIAAGNIAGGGGGGGGGSSSGFLYTVTGLEPDRSDFTVTLPVAKITTAYMVTMTCQGVVAIVQVDIPHADNTLTTFHVIGTDAFTAGDVLAFQVTDL